MRPPNGCTVPMLQRIRGPLRSTGYSSRKNPPRGRRRAAWPPTRAQLRLRHWAGSHALCAWVGRRQPRADGVHNDRCRGQFCCERARQALQSSFADSIPRCRAASDCEAEGRIGVGAGAATHVDDPRVCTSPQQRQKRLNHSPAAEQVDLHNALGGLQVSCTADLRQST